MRTALTFIAAVMTFISATASSFNYAFDNTPISEAIVRISKDHPGINISFIYKELDKYRTSARIHTDDPYEALRKTVGMNPVSVIRRGNDYFIEALQHGKYVYSGRAVGDDGRPVAAATVMLLAPKDSTVVTYGIADGAGRFRIPCDRRDVIAKLSCLGYRPVYRRSTGFTFGDVVMPVSATKLRQVDVEAQAATVYTDKTVFIPTSRQKNASQTGADLIDHIGIPQLRVSLEGNISTSTGQNVAAYIDFVPATSEDLKAMRMSDVKRVEYYDFPSDPRLQGNDHAVNFIMTKYEYGGYVKGYGGANLISYSGQLLANVRLQNKRMTYDLMGYGYDADQRHAGSDNTETYRLPQSDGTMKVFDRDSRTTASKDKTRQYFATFKATYNSENVLAMSQISGSIFRRPKVDRSGYVRYTPADFPDSDFSSNFSSTSKFINFTGYYFFSLPKNNTVTFTPTYRYSQTDQTSTYLETGYAPIDNDAYDHTNEVSGELRYSHDFGRCGSLQGFVKGSYEYNHTRYAGSVESLDKARSSRIGIGASYSVTVRNLQGKAGFGWDWDRLQFGDIVDRPSAPWFDISLNYSLKEKHSIYASFSTSTWAPSPDAKSDNIIQATPLMRYTGNPALRPLKNYTVEANYSWYPNNNLSFGAFGLVATTRDRYVYDYEASATGILRTVKQPLGGYLQSKYGINGSVKLFDRSLVLNASLVYAYDHNGAPYSFDESQVNWGAGARYYVGHWNFSFNYYSPRGASDGIMNGVWVKDKSSWYLSVGWFDSHWNIRATFRNMTRWHWRGTRMTMHSEYYDFDEQMYNGYSRAMIQLTATYTFGFGKKVDRSNEPRVSGSASSGILH